MQHAQCDGLMGIVKPDGEKFIFRIINDCHLATFTRAVLMLDAVGERPWVPFADGEFGAFGEAQFEAGQGHGVGRIQRRRKCH